MDVVAATKSKRARNKYHTNTKIQAKLGILPAEVVKRIPKSTLHDFKNYDFPGLFQFTEQEDCELLLVLAEKIVNSRILRKTLHMYKAYDRLKTTALQIFSQVKNIKPHLKKYKEKIVAVINRVKDTVGLHKACRFFRISVSRFYSWLHQVNHPCSVSALRKCRHRWSNQITQQEEKTMVNCCNDPFFKGWAVYQIAEYALTHNILSVSTGTWYKYLNVLGIHLHRIKKKPNKKGIRALQPNGIWHMDVTVYKTIDNIKAYIYILIDNFSRFILAWKTALFISGEVCMNMIRDAYKKYLEPVKQQEPETLLLCDGGSENNNEHVDGFLEQKVVPIKKLIAQKDIQFSNSMIEAFNKTLKYRHLFQNEITDFESLNKHLTKFIPEYNNVRPHCAHKYYTPAQVYFGQNVDIENIRKQYEEARKMRILENKKAICPDCSPA